MKSMTCRDLGGACDYVFRAATFEEIGRLSMAHGKEMAAKNDQPHLDAMTAMGPVMADPQLMSKWLAEKQAAFDNSPEV